MDTMRQSRPLGAPGDRHKAKVEWLKKASLGLGKETNSTGDIRFRENLSYKTQREEEAGGDLLCLREHCRDRPKAELSGI